MYLTLEQAAKIATLEKGFEVPTADLLRAGVLGYLVICCPLAHGEFYNPVSNDTEFRAADFFVIPPKALLEIETFGETETEVVHSMGEQKAMLFVKRVVKLDHLRVFYNHLIAFIPRLLSTENVTPVQNHVPDNRTHSTKDSNQGDLSSLMKSIHDRFKTSNLMWDELNRLANLPADQRPSFLKGLGNDRKKITIQFTEKGSNKEFTKVQFNKRFHDLFDRKEH